VVGDTVEKAGAEPARRCGVVVLFAGMAVGFALGMVVAALLAVPAADPGCDHCVLAEARSPRRGATTPSHLTA